MKRTIDFENGLVLNRRGKPQVDTRNHQYVSRGRDALHIICGRIKHYYPYYRIFLPAFVCDVVPRVFSANGLTVRFYDIHDDLTIDMESLHASGCNGNAIVLYVNYFGFNQPVETIRQLTAENNILIEDNSQAGLNQSLLEKGGGSGWSFSSFRKLLPCADGSILTTFNMAQSVPVELKPPSLLWLGARFLGLLFKTIALRYPDHYTEALRQEMFTLAVKKISFNPPARISRLSQWQHKRIDLKKVSERRRKNYAYLENNMADNRVEMVKNLTDEITPFGFPVYTSKRDEIKETLLEKKINAAILWDAKQVGKNGEQKIALAIASKILVLPVGQSYTEKDMERVAECIKSVS